MYREKAITDMIYSYRHLPLAKLSTSIESLMAKLILNIANQIISDARQKSHAGARIA